MSCETLNVRVQNQASLGGPRRGGRGGGGGAKSCTELSNTSSLVNTSLLTLQTSDQGDCQHFGREMDQV